MLICLLLVFLTEKHASIFNSSFFNLSSLEKTVFSQLKGMFGDRLASKRFHNLEAETIFKRHILNRMLRA